MTGLGRAPALFVIAALAACSPAFNGGTPEAGSRLPAASAVTTAPAAPPLTLNLGTCAAPVVCTSVPNLATIVFHGAAAANAQVVITPQEAGYAYGYAVEYCIQESKPLAGVVTELGDQLSECRNVDGFIDAMDNIADPKFPTSTQSIEFPGDEAAPPSPKNAMYNNASFPAFPYGRGLPQNGTYGFAVKLHVHDANGNFNTVKLQWCPTASCGSV